VVLAAWRIILLLPLGNPEEHRSHHFQVTIKNELPLSSGLREEHCLQGTASTVLFPSLGYQKNLLALFSG
jgi:hypothetical protein